MASSSSSPRTWRYRVFASFHGPDVRKTFMSHLRKQFNSNGITMFDDQGIQRSQIIAPALTQAIRESRVSIVILSKNYASSRWCLDELLEILKCKEDLGQIVMTVFYGVDPSDVRKQFGDFGSVFNETCARKTQEEVRKWSQALTDVGNIAGEHFLNWDNEAKMIEKIAIDVSEKLNTRLSWDFDDMVGLEAHLIEMMSLLDLDYDGVKMVAITGPAGIGKSTIARALYSLLSYRFQLTSFVDNLREIHHRGLDDYGLKLLLQEQFLTKILNQNGMTIFHLGAIEERLYDQKVLIILDDVDDLKQLEVLVGETTWFGPGSRIIVTTENQELLWQHGFHNAYHVDFPSSEAALEILCINAFKQSYPPNGFENLALNVTELCGNLPLGLRVVGSYLRGKEEEEWKTILDHRDIKKVLETISVVGSYFHIAVFFNYKDCGLVKSMPIDDNGLNSLVNKSLICTTEYLAKLNMQKSQLKYLWQGTQHKHHQKTMATRVRINNTDYLTLDQLNRKRCYRRTVVRLIRKWEARNLKKNKELIGINFLLLDEKENTIQCFVHHALLIKFGDKLCEGNLIEICNFIVQDCNKSYKVSDHKFMIRLTEYTTVNHMGEQFCEIPLEKFRFRNYEEFTKLKDQTNDLYDAIGYIKNMNKSRSQTTPTLRRVTLTLLLEGGVEIPATIWTEQAEQLEDKYRGMENKNIVLIMTSVMIKMYQGAIFLSASSGTKFYLKKDCDSITAFRESLRYDGDCLINLCEMIEQNSNNNTCQHSINDIWDFISSDIPREKKFVCKATITKIVLRNGWNYISCSSCSTKLEKIVSSLFCTNCGKSQSVGILRFRLEVIVDDGSDFATFVIFDKDGSKIIGATAEEVKQDGLEDIPTIVQAIVGEIYLFEIKIKKNDFDASYQSFTVAEILRHLKPISKDSNCGSKREEREEQEEPSGNLQKKART